MELVQVCDSRDLKERLGNQVRSLIICRARRCILSSWASEVVDEPIQERANGSLVYGLSVSGAEYWSRTTQEV